MRKTLCFLIQAFLSAFWCQNVSLGVGGVCFLNAKSLETKKNGLWRPFSHVLHIYIYTTQILLDLQIPVFSTWGTSKKCKVIFRGMNELCLQAKTITIDHARMQERWEPHSLGQTPGEKRERCRGKIMTKIKCFPDHGDEKKSILLVASSHLSCVHLGGQYVWCFPASSSLLPRCTLYMRNLIPPFSSLACLWFFLARGEKDEAVRSFAGLSQKIGAADVVVSPFLVGSREEIRSFAAAAAAALRRITLLFNRTGIK